MYLAVDCVFAFRAEDVLHSRKLCCPSDFQVAMTFLLLIDILWQIRKKTFQNRCSYYYRILLLTSIYCNDLQHLLPHYDLFIIFCHPDFVVSCLWLSSTDFRLLSHSFHLPRLSNVLTPSTALIFTVFLFP